MGVVRWGICESEVRGFVRLATVGLHENSKIRLVPIDLLTVF